MTTRRPFLAVLLTLTTACAAAPAVAAAETPVWQPPLVASGAATDTQQPTHAAAPDGSLAVVWEQTDGGETQLAARTRTAQGVWSEPQIVSNTPGGIGAGGGYLFALADDGSATVAWIKSDYSQRYMATKQPGDAPWVVSTQPEDAGEYFWGADLVPGPDDSLALLTTGGIDGDRKLRLRLRPSGSDSLVLDSEIDTPDDETATSPRIAFNSKGDGVAIWRADLDGGGRETHAARYDGASNTWSAPEVVDDAATDGPQLAFNDDGAAVALLESDDDLRASAMDAATGEWSAPTQLMVSGPNVVLPSVAADNDGQFIATWQEMDFSNVAVIRLMTSTYSVVQQTWSAADQITHGPLGLAGAPSLAVNADGDMVLGLITTNDGITLNSAAAIRESGSSEFGPISVSPAENVSSSQFGVPAATIDDEGNVLLMFPKSVGSGLQVGFVAGDASGPEIGATNVPASGTVGVPVRFTTTSPFDLWSAVASTSWAFGDGATAAGTSVLHTYTNPGRYRVSFLATDSSGFETQSEERYITIAPAPLPPVIDDEDEDDEDEDVPPPPRKKVDPPIIEARLSGRTITLKAKVTLRKGKRCTGKALATTKFGRRTYRTTLRLKNYGTTCRATGKIRLKKTPSTRTRLRIKIKNSNLKTRTITTKRA
jgi:hypothetical protein